MAAEIGGYVGLLLGVSFIDLVNFLKFSFIQRKERAEAERNKVINIKHGLDSSIRPSVHPIIFTH